MTLVPENKAAQLPREVFVAMLVLFSCEELCCFVLKLDPNCPHQYSGALSWLQGTIVAAGAGLSAVWVWLSGILTHVTIGGVASGRK